MDDERQLQRWLDAGVLDQAAVVRIRAFEAGQSHPTERLRWPTIVALVFGALLLGAGVLLFVSAHWDELSPVQRMSLVVLMVTVFHVGGAAVSSRFEGLSIALHTVGTISLGAGIALTGQIYHLSEDWPEAILLWALGALMAWGLLRHWTQGAMAALLVPLWMSSEWVFHITRYQPFVFRPVVGGICALAITYLSAPLTNPLNRALVWLGAVALLPSAILLAADIWDVHEPQRGYAAASAVGWTLALGLPLLLAFLLRGAGAVWNVGAVGWIGLLALMNLVRSPHIAVFIGCAIGAGGLTAWGVREQRPERINLGMAGFAITVLVYYFSDVMDRLDRSLSLILLGLLFLGGGWLLERTRRRLVAAIREVSA
jgi:uncharacterized membrane protein